MKPLEELFRDNQSSMSSFQHDWFVTVRAGGTLYGQYKQALRELHGRFRGSMDTEIKMERLRIEIEELQNEMDHEEDHTFNYRKLAVDLKEKTMHLYEYQRQQEENLREFVRFYQQACWLKEFVGQLDDKKRRRLEEDLWIYRIKEMACIDYVSTGGIRNTTYEFMNALPKKLRLKVAEEIHDPKELSDWYCKKDPILVPEEFPAISAEAVKQILDFDYGALNRKAGGRIGGDGRMEPNTPTAGRATN